MTEAINPIPNRIRNAAVGGHVCGSVDIIDDYLGLEQSAINEAVAPMPYNSTTPNGMGKVVLKKNDNFKEVVEAQTNGNTIFVIKYDFDLNNEDVAVPVKCMLLFEGGTINNGTITLSDNCSMFGKNKEELKEVHVNMRGVNIHIDRIDSESSIISPAFEHSTRYNYPNDFSNLLIENCRIIAHGVNGANEGISGSAIHLGSDYENGLMVNNIVIRNNIIYHRAMGVEFNNHSRDDSSPYGPTPDVLRLKDITVENNYIKCIVPETQYGFNISISGRIKNVMVKNNTLIDGREAVEVVGHNNSIYVLNNSFICETPVARWYWFDWSASLDELGEDYVLADNTFMSTQRNPLYWQYLKNVKITGNKFYHDSSIFRNCEDVEFTCNYCDCYHGHTIISIDGCERVNVCYNVLLQGSNAYICYFTSLNDIDPSKNVIAHNFFKKGGNTYSFCKSNEFGNDNFIYDNVDMATGKAYKEEGTTAERPTLYLPIGYKYYDTDDKELKIWNGSSFEGRFVRVNGTAPLSITDTAGGLLAIKDASGSSVSLFAVRFYEIDTPTEITNNGRFIVKRETNGGALTITRVDPSNTAPVTAVLQKVQ